MSALFTDAHRKCGQCGNRAGVWPIGADDQPHCPSCDAPQPVRIVHSDGTSYPASMPWWAKVIWFVARPLNRWSER